MSTPPGPGLTGHVCICRGACLLGTLCYDSNIRRQAMEISREVHDSQPTTHDLQPTARAIVPVTASHIHNQSSPNPTRSEVYCLGVLVTSMDESRNSVALARWGAAAALTMCDWDPDQALDPQHRTPPEP